eukprot:15362826-Ditylum_brightwellii.AAC.1
MVVESLVMEWAQKQLPVVVVEKCHEKGECMQSGILLLGMGCLALGAHFVTSNSGGEQRGVNLHVNVEKSKLEGE